MWALNKNDWPWLLMGFIGAIMVGGTFPSEGVFIAHVQARLCCISLSPFAHVSRERLLDIFFLCEVLQLLEVLFQELHAMSRFLKLNPPPLPKCSLKSTYLVMFAAKHGMWNLKRRMLKMEHVATSRVTYTPRKRKGCGRSETAGLSDSSALGFVRLWAT